MNGLLQQNVTFNEFHFVYSASRPPVPWENFFGEIFLIE